MATEVQKQQQVETLEVGVRYQIKHTRISEGKVTKVHRDLGGDVELYDLEISPGRVRRISPHQMLGHKAVLSTPEVDHDC